ncbi:MAG: hypothetical protein IKV53_07255 [Clostridia bacterium]|nr:hypothetical protein [Clostridia bacterium]
MALIINSSKKVTVGTNAITVPTSCSTFIVTNASGSATVYMRENSDGAPCTSENGFAILPGQSLPMPICAGSLSMIATASADVFFLIGTED